MELRRDLSLKSLTMAVVTGTIGSGWLFASYFAAKSAGAISLPAWGLGGVIAFLLALVFAELGSLINSSGALAQIPLLSHGRLAGFIGGWSIWISYLCVPTIELLAMIDYLASSVPWLTRDQQGVQVLSGPGLAVAFALMLLFTWINLNGIKGLARWIDNLTIWKLIVPLLVAGVLMALSGHWGNLQIPVHHATHAASGVNGPAVELMAAVGSGGILFCLLGFRTAVDLAGEARNPQRNVPLAMGLGLGISLLIYLVLQLSFLVSVPPNLLQNGWQQLQLNQHGGPLAALALGLGLGWMVVLLLIDAALSPSATAMAYLGVSARVSWMMGRCQLLPQRFGHVNRQGVPDVAVMASLVVGAAMFLVGPGWQQVVAFLTAAQMIALAMGPPSLLALRRQLPNETGHFQLRWATLISALAFVAASWACNWCGRIALEGAVVAIGLPSLIYAAACWIRRQPIDTRAGAWWALYLGMLVLDMELFSTGRPLALGTGIHLLVLAGLSLLVLPVAVHTALPVVSPHALTSLGTATPAVPSR